MAIITSSELPDADAGTRGVRRGKLIRLTAGIYSDEVRKNPELIVAENWREIVGKLMPNAVLTDRSAFSGRPEAGYLFVDHTRRTPFKLPGLTVIPNGRGEGPQPGDTSLGDGVYLASEARALVDNMRPSRSISGRPQRTLTRTELHDCIVHITAGRNPDQLQKVIDDAKDFAEQAGRRDDGDSIVVFFQSAMGKKPTVKSGSLAMSHAQRDTPFDGRRVAAFQRLSESLSNHQPRPRYVPADSNQRRYLPVFEAYFSNFIEGTEFDIDEAIDIALNGTVPAARPADAHDIIGTFKIVNNADDMSLRAASADQFIDILRRRHASIMEGRPDKRPGEFKQIANRAGFTVFVAPEFVESTLRAGWVHLEEIEDPFARAAYTMFLVSEVHPFDDGNGRLARIMMNGELAAAEESRIIIPTILRGDYLSSLSRISHNEDPRGLIRVLDFAQRWTYQSDFSTIEAALKEMQDSHAFTDPLTAEQQGIRLELPSSRRYDDVAPANRVV